jgi:hypothetical protein
VIALPALAGRPASARFALRASRMGSRVLFGAFLTNSQQPLDILHVDLLIRQL